MESQRSRKLGALLAALSALAAGTLVIGITTPATPVNALVTAGGTLRVNVAEAVGGKTVFGQLTVAGVTGPGFVTAYGCDDGIPRDSKGNINKSDLNYDGAVTPVTSNRLIVKADNDGDICFYTLTKAEMIVDINGVTDTGVTAIANQRTDTRNTLTTTPAGAGLTVLYAGHSFGQPFAWEMTELTRLAGIDGHEQRIVFRGGNDYGSPQGMWEDPEAQALIKEQLNDGAVDIVVLICCSREFMETGFQRDQALLEIVAYALAQNPETRFRLAMPWNHSPNTYATAAEHRALTDAAYPHYQLLAESVSAASGGAEVSAFYHGAAVYEIRSRYENGLIPELTGLIGASSSSVFTDETGHAAAMAKDAGALIWLNALYEINPLDLPPMNAYDVDIRAIAAAALSATGGALRVNVAEAVGGKTVFGQLTVAGVTGPGFVTAYGCDDGIPRDSKGNINKSDLNYDGAVTPVTSNRLIVKADNDGDICFYTLTKAEMIVDINGVTDTGVTAIANQRTDTRTTTTTQPAVPVNPGDTKNCGDFATYAQAKAWFDTYYPHYGDIAKLDQDGDRIPCE